jgi:hypothetical protein
VKPYRIRMMTEICCDFALWGELDRELPIGDGSDRPDLEHRLPISERLRTEILRWANEWYRYDADDFPDIDDAEFDERGMRLSRELQQELGTRYSVRYLFTFAGSRERLLPLAKQQPYPGWRVG